MKRISKILLALVLIVSLTGCGSQSKDVSNTGDSIKNKVITLSTTTSTENSGLLDFLLPEFEKDTGIKVKVVAVGTGQALEMGKMGDADVLLVHAKDSEIAFVEGGYGVERIEVMYNDFVLVGPKNDKIKVKEKFPNDILKAMTLLAISEGSFISRGDDSGTHKMELSLWKKIQLEVQGSWYLSVGQGMGKVLQMADEMEAYTLSDRATYLSMKENLDLDIVVEGDSQLYNQYSAIAVNNKVHPNTNIEGANKFIEWLVSEKGQEMIGDFGKEKYGQSLFIPNALK